MSADRPPWSPAGDNDDTSAPRCQACDSQVTPQFARVFGDNRDVVHACPDCETLRVMDREASNAGGIN